MASLNGRTVLITGAARGIGAATARRLAHGRRQAGPRRPGRRRRGEARRRAEAGGGEGRRHQARRHRAHGERALQALGPARRALQQRGRHSRGADVRRHRGGVGSRHGREPARGVLRDAGGGEAHGEAGRDGGVGAAGQADPDRVHRVVSGRQSPHDAVLGVQGGGGEPHAVRGAAPGARAGHLQLRVPGGGRDADVGADRPRSGARSRAWGRGRRGSGGSGTSRWAGRSGRRTSPGSWRSSRGRIRTT